MTPETENLVDVAELVRQVRHDANNPLTAALGHVQLLLESPALPNEEFRASLRVVETELLRLVSILRRLKDVKLPADAGDSGPTA